MSERHMVQDATGVVISEGANVIMYILSTSAPSDSVAGYGIGCVWINKAGTAGGVMYVNIGTLALSNWINIV